MIKKIIAALIILVFTGCEKTEIVEIDLEQEEYIVIRSEVKTDEYFSGVSISRTLPAGINYDIKFAEIKDAYAYIRINETQVIPLHYTSDGIYKSKYDFKIEAGNIYELFGKAGAKEFYGKTRAPYKPAVISASYTPEQYYLANIAPESGEAYGAVWVIAASTEIKADDFYSIEKLNSENPIAAINVRTPTLPEEYQTSTYSGRRFFQVFAFDDEFQLYFQTRGKNSPVDNSFVQSGSSVHWNVLGEKVIGLFIGVAEGNISGEIR